MAVFLQNASGNSRCSTFSQTNIAESQWVITHHSSLIINNFTTVQEFWRTPENAQGQQNVFQESKDITSLVANSRKVLGAYGRLATLTCPEIWCGQAVDCNNSLKRRRRHTCCSQKKWMLAWHRRSADVYFTFTAHFIAFYVKQINSTLGRDFSVKKQQIASLPVMEVRYQLASRNFNIFTFANQRFGEACWHNVHIVLHALSLLVIVQCVAVMNISVFQIRRPEQNTELKAKTEQFITAKTSGNALKWRSRTYSVLRPGLWIRSPSNFVWPKPKIFRCWSRSLKFGLYK